MAEVKMPFLSLLVLSLAATCLARPAADPKPPNLAYLFSVNLTLPGPVSIGSGPRGIRAFFPIAGGSFAGPKLSGNRCSSSLETPAYKTVWNRTHSDNVM